MIKKLLIFLTIMITNFSFINSSYAATRDVGDGSIKDGLIKTTSDNIAQSTANDGLEATFQIAVWIKDSLMAVIILIAVGVFLFIGIKLAFARGNPEEFKKAMMQLVYAVVGVFVVSIAWAVVSLLTGINL